MVDYAGEVVVRIKGDYGPLTRDMNAAHGEARKFDRAATGGFNEANRAIGRMNGSLGLTKVELGGIRTTALMATSALTAMAAGLFGGGAALRTLGGFEQSMAGVGAISRATGEDLRGLRDIAKDLGATTEYSASQAAVGLKFFAMAGWSARESIEAIPAVLDLATAASMDLGRAADVSSNIMSAFGIAASDASSVADVLAAASSRANTDVGQLGEAMKFVGPVASALGVSMNDAAAAIGAMSDAGIQGSMAGTSLRRILSNLTGGSAEVRKGLASIGLQMADVNPKTVSLTEIIRKLAEGGLDAATAFQIFGDRGAPAVLALVENEAKLNDLTAALKDVEGEAKRMATTMRDQLMGDFKNFASAAESVVIALGESGVTGALRGVTQTGTAGLRLLAENSDMVLIATGLLAARIAGPMVAAQIAATAATTAHAAALVTGNATLISGRKAADLRTASMLQSALADHVAKQATLESAQAELARAQAIQVAAKAGQIAGVTEAQAKANVVAATRAVSAAQVQLAAASGRATAAIGAQTVAMRANTVAARAMALAASTASSALALVGGPAGAAILGIGAAMYVTAQRAAEASDRSQRYAEVIRQAGINSADAAGGIREAVAALEAMSEAATNAERDVKRMAAQRDLAASMKELESYAQRLDLLMDADDVIGRMSNPIRQEMDAAIAAFRDGEMSAEEFIDKVDDIAKANPDASPVIAEIQRIAREAAAAMGVLDGLAKMVQAVGSMSVTTTPKTDRLGAPQPLSEYDMWLRTGGMDDLSKKLQADIDRRNKETKGGGGGRGRKSEAERAAERYKDIISDGEQFIAMQEMERRAIHLTEEAAAALRFEFDMLAEAQRGGTTITEAQALELGRLAEEMAAAEAATKAAKDEMEFWKGATRGALGDLKSALEDGKLSWQELGDIAMNVLSKMVDKILDDLVDALFQANKAASGFGGGGGLLKGLFSLFGFAKGGAFSGGNVIPFARGGVVSGPTLFPMENGMGLMGEAGPEAVMPLRRGADGRLGVSAMTAANSNRPGAMGGGFGEAASAMAHLAASANIAASNVVSFGADARDVASGLHETVRRDGMVRKEPMIAPVRVEVGRGGNRSGGSGEGSVIKVDISPIDVRVAADRDGLNAYVDGRAEAKAMTATGALADRIGDMVDSRNNTAQTRGSRP